MLSLTRSFRTAAQASASAGTLAPCAHRAPQPAAPEPTSRARPHRRRNARCRASGAAGSGAGGEAAASRGDAQPVPPPVAPAPPEPPAWRPGVSRGPAGPTVWRNVLARCWALLQRSLWPICAAHFVADMSVFLVHRISLTVLGVSGVLTLPAVANLQTGLQPLAFVLWQVINVAAKSWASLATILLCRESAGLSMEPVPLQHPVRGVRRAVRQLKDLQPQITVLWSRVVIVELLVAAVVLPLQYASLAVVSLPLTLPWIVELQAAAPAAVVEGSRGLSAMKRSRALLRPLRWQLAIPFAALLLAGRLLELGKAALLNAMPHRFYTQLIELPLAVLLGGAVLSALLARMQDVLPIVAYTEAIALESEQAETCVQEV